jgi:hypothetical protein
VSLKLYRRVPGGLEPSPVEPSDWRTRLRSRRWRTPELENPEIEPISAKRAVLFFGALLVLTFVLLVLGNLARVWTVPT